MGGVGGVEGGVDDEAAARDGTEFIRRWAERELADDALHELWRHRGNVVEAEKALAARAGEGKRGRGKEGGSGEGGRGEEEGGPGKEV